MQVSQLLVVIQDRSEPVWTERIKLHHSSPPEMRDLHEIKYVIPQPLVGTVIGPYCHICSYKTAINMKSMINWFCTVKYVLKPIKITFTSFWIAPLEQKNLLLNLPIIEDTTGGKGSVQKNYILRKVQHITYKLLSIPVPFNVPIRSYLWKVFFIG